jgi:beta-glucanase (GH16 family)
VKSNQDKLDYSVIFRRSILMKKVIVTSATLLFVSWASAAMTNLFPNGNFDSPAGVATPWLEVFGGGTTTYSYPTTGGNPGGYGRMNNSSGWGIWVGQSSSTAGYAIAPLGLVAGGNYDFVMDMKNFSGTGIGKLKIECWAGGVRIDEGPEIAASGQSGAWVTYTFNRTLVPGTTDIKIVPIAGAGSGIGYDNIGVIVPSAPLTAAITSPANGAVVNSDFSIDATAMVAPGTITNVAFYDGPSLLGNDTTAPYSYAVTGAASGAHALTVVARDSGGNSVTSAVVNITVSNPPPLPGWQLVWSDEFSGTSVDSTKWSYDIGNGVNGWGNDELQYYTSRATNVFVTNGFLNIIARKEVPQYENFDYTSAKLISAGKFSKKYGRFEFRARVPQGKGYWPALWMMPQDSAYGGWAASGEIDVMENKGRLPNMVSGAIHYGGSWPNNTFSFAEYTFPNGGVATDFHIYALEWTTNSLKWYVDGVLFQTRTSWYSTAAPYPAPFDQPFYLIMNLAVGGRFDGNPDGSRVFPGLMQVDYVRVYDPVTAPLTVPPAPTGFTVSPGNANVYLKWDAVPNATAYQVKRATSSGGTYTIIATPTTNNFTDASVANCSTYYYVVAATNSVGASTNSAEQAAVLGAYSLAVNSGGSAAGHFVADANVTGGTIGAVSTATIDTAGLVAPAPQSVYQAERYGNFTYTFPGLISGATYKVRLHSAETYWTATGQRRFNVLINGAQVLTNFDIIAAAGAPNKAVINEFNAVAAGGQITIQYATVTDNARASGIEIILSQPAAPAELAATAGNAQVALNWPPLAGATYNVKRGLASDGPFTTIFNGLAGPNCVDSGLTNGVTYHYVVSAVLLGCESTNSASVSATPVCTPPAPPAAGNNGPLWTGMTLNLTAATIPGATYNWTGPNGFNSTNQNPSILNATTANSGLFSVTASVGGCTSSAATTAVIVNPPATLEIHAMPGSVILSWPGGTLQSATNLTGPWGDIPGATSPRTNPAATAQEYYRIRLQ